MASKNSSGASAAESQPSSPATSTSGVPMQSPLVPQFYAPRGRGTRVTTTALPTTTGTPSPTPDPNEYEKSTHADVRLTDGELNLLKEQVRLLHGLPLAARPPPPKRLKKLFPPKMMPRATLTSQRRAELQRRRMIVRCADLKERFDEYDRMTKSANPALVYRQLRRDAMATTNEEMNLRFERRELDNLKQLAERARKAEVFEYRDNQGSRLRFKFVRGEPIISGNFRDAFDAYTKPPFALPRRVRRPKIYNLPQIDKSKEIWLVPVVGDVGAGDDNDAGAGIPLDRQPKLPDPSDTRTDKERARPPVKKGKRTPMTEWRAKQKGSKPHRPPWIFAASFGSGLGC